MKTCKKCNEEKELTEFRKNKQYKDGKDSVCKACRKQEYKENPSPQMKYYYDNIDKVKEYKAKERERNRKYYSDYAREYRKNNYESENERMRKYRENNKDKFNEYQRQRKARESVLDSLHPEFNESVVYEQFTEDICCLTGKTDGVTLDHFIPFAWGHGGTYVGNVYPVNTIINQSKSHFNPFKWMEWALEDYEIDIHKWNKLIETLANINELTVDEFKDFVNWCENNKRTLEDIEQNPIPSLELWKLNKNNYTQQTT